MRLATPQGTYQFERAALEFLPGKYQNVFALKNNKTVQETLAHLRYAKFQARILDRYNSETSKPLGQFLLELKIKGDDFYKKFLNPYGDGTFSRFRLTDPVIRQAKGLYAYVTDGTVVYIGRCRDSMSKRIDLGYGKIHPKNCYIDGQATNCHLNGRITPLSASIALWVCVCDSNQEIEIAERDCCVHTARHGTYIGFCERHARACRGIHVLRWLYEDKTQAALDCFVAIAPRNGGSWISTKCCDYVST